MNDASELEPNKLAWVWAYREQVKLLTMRSICGSEACAPWQKVFELAQQKLAGIRTDIAALKQTERLHGKGADRLEEPSSTGGQRAEGLLAPFVDRWTGECPRSNKVSEEKAMKAQAILLVLCGLQLADMTSRPMHKEKSAHQADSKRYRRSPSAFSIPVWLRISLFRRAGRTAEFPRLLWA